MKILYQCEGCEEQYASEAECRRCETQKDEVRFAVGDIVLGRYGFGWFDGDRDWVSNPELLLPGLKEARPKHCPRGDGNCFGKCCTLGFYYVVSAIDTYEHRTRYHLRTGAMRSGYQSERTTNDEGGWRKVPNPPNKVLTQARSMIGRKSDEVYG